jgi:hypothetical protein
MRRKPGLRRPSPAMAVALAALFIALGGTSYAALSANSVGTKQLKNKAVTTKKIKNGAVTATKINPNGLTVPNALNANSATNATNAANATKAGNASNLGGKAPSAYEQYGATLPVGQTETGAYEMGVQYGAGGGLFDGTISFPRRLAAAPTPHFIRAGSVAPAQCPGTASSPAAQSGNLCVYEAAGSETSTEFIATTDGTVGASAFGTGLRLFDSSSGELFSEGTWAVTG